MNNKIEYQRENKTAPIYIFNNNTMSIKGFDLIYGIKLDCYNTIKLLIKLCEKDKSNVFYKLGLYNNYENSIKHEKLKEAFDGDKNNFINVVFELLKKYYNFDLNKFQRECTFNNYAHYRNLCDKHEIKHCDFQNNKDDEIIIGYIVDEIKFDKYLDTLTHLNNF